MATAEMPFLKNLASSDRRTRTVALDSIRLYLGRPSVEYMPPIEFLKLWKGLFVSLWMCDRPIPQQNLCADLAGLIEVLPRNAVLPFLRGFWATMAREWTTGIDVHRINKFLLLVRRMLGASFRSLRATNVDCKSEDGSMYDKTRIGQVLKIVEDWPLARDEEVPRNDDGDPYTIPAGLRIQFLDVWVDEAEAAGLLEEDDQEGAYIVRRISELIDELEQHTTSTAVRARAKESLEDERLPANRGKRKGEESGALSADADDDASWDGFDD